MATRKLAPLEKLRERIRQLEADNARLLGLVSGIEATATLRVSEAQYRAVVEDQTEIISRFLPDGSFVFVNDVFCRMFGKTYEELIGQTWHPAAHPDDVSVIEAKLRLMSRDNPVVVIENRVYLPNGELRWMQFVNRGHFDAEGHLSQIQSVGRDINERKQIELRLHESEERLELALSGSGLVIWDDDISAGKVVTDKRIIEMLGYSPEELEDRDTWWQLVDPRDLADVERIFTTHLQGDTESMHSEHRLRHKEGHWVTVEMRAKVVRRDITGAPLRLVGTLLDVTQRERLSGIGVGLLKQIEALIREATSGSPVNATGSETLHSLTKRERQILGMIAEGMTSAQIGERLKLATNTVTNHRQNIMAKLNRHNAAGLTRFAIDHGLTNRQ